MLSRRCVGRHGLKRLLLITCNMLEGDLSKIVAIWAENFP